MCDDIFIVSLWLKDPAQGLNFLDCLISCWSCWIAWFLPRPSTDAPPDGSPFFVFWRCPWKFLVCYASIDCIRASICCLLGVEICCLYPFQLMKVVLTTLEILTNFYRNSHTSVLKLWLKVKVHGCPNRFPRIMNEQLDWTWWECRVGCGPALLVPLGLSRLLGVYWLYPCIDRMWSAVGGFLEIGWGGAVPHMCSHFKRDTSLWLSLPSDIRSGVSAFRRFGSSGTQMCSLLQRCFAREYIA